MRLYDYQKIIMLKTSEFHCELNKEIYFGRVIIITRNFYITYSRAPFTLEFRPLNTKYYILLQCYNSAMKNISLSNNDYKKHILQL